MKTEVGIFIDTAGWIALIHRRDDYHQRAKRIYAGLGHVKRMTTDAVLIESCNIFSKVPLRPLAIALMEKKREAEKTWCPGSRSCDRSADCSRLGFVSEKTRQRLEFD